jgi:NADH dehydrogenase FAD-containing subunit
MLDTPVLVLKLIKAAISFGIDTLLSKLRSLLHKLTYKEVESPKNVVIIGASFAGCQAAKSLATSLPTGYRVILVEKSSHFQFTWVFPRFSVISGHEHKAFIPYDNLVDGAPLGSYKMVRDTVNSISKTAVSLESGHSLEYEYLIIATGSQAGTPSRLNVNRKEDGIEVLKNLQDAIAGAGKLAVVGGGPAGVELALDAKCAHPLQEVTLVHSRSALLQNFGQKLHVTALAALEKASIRVILGERVKAESKAEVTLESGERVACDLVVCRSQIPVSSLHDPNNLADQLYRSKSGIECHSSPLSRFSVSIRRLHQGEEDLANRRREAWSHIRRRRCRGH